MDVLFWVYFALGIFIIICLFIVLFFIAGREIINEFYRRFNPRGCDVYIVNHNRQMLHYYKVPQDGVFKIKDRPYITNPDKLLSLDDKMRDEAKKSIAKRQQAWQEKISRKTLEVNHLEQQITALKKAEGGEKVVQSLAVKLQKAKQDIEIYKKKLETREQLYYHKKRGSFFYIEGDPVPKDFHELYTEMDAIMLDNMIARAQTKDPKAVRDLEGQLKMMKWVTWGMIIVGIILLFIVFQNNGMIRQIAEAQGLTMTI